MDFEKRYKELNPQQKKAVNTIEGPVMVVAGPGTGKTEILTLRIANILKKTDTPPEAVLALTFTEKATYNMRQRLIEMIGEAAYRVHIRTFHGFCNEVIQTEPDEFPHIIGGSSITEPDQLRLLEAIIMQRPLKWLRPLGRPEAYVRSVKGAIDDLKREGVSPDDFEAMLVKEKKVFAATEDLADESGKTRAKYRSAEKAIFKQQELAGIYREYQDTLLRDNFYDFADMLMEVAKALETDEDLRLTFQEKYLYILVDEHQDSNRTQNRIVQLIGEFHDQPNIFVVGDLQQAIYRFQGASLENFRDFTARYPKAAIIKLQENYRSTQAVLEAAAGISPKQGSLKAKAGHKEGPVALYAFPSPAIQEYAIAGMIRERIKTGTKLENIAILYRTNAEAEPVARMLERLNVPYAVESDDEVLEDPQIRRLLLIARTACHMDDPGSLLRTLYIDFLGVAPLDVFKISAYATRQRVNVWDIIRSDAELKKLNLEDPARVKAVFKMLSLLARECSNKSAGLALESLVRETGFLPHGIKLPGGDRVLAKLHALFDLVRSQMESAKDLTMTGFLDSLDLLSRHGGSLRVQIVPPEHTVRLMTVHKAKGLEFDTVFIINAAHGRWDGARKPPELKLPDAVWRITAGLDEEEDSEADTRNLFYVALTRAKKEAIITWSERKADGKEQSPSVFVLAIPAEYKKQADVSRWAKEYEKHRDVQFAEPSRTALLTQKEYLNQLFRTQGLSVTALNNFLDCPWRYFFTNLVRIPEAPSVPSEYGKAAHAALKAFFDKFAAAADPGKNYLVSHFETALKRAPLPERQIEQALAEGKKILSGYYDWYVGKWPEKIITEQKIDGMELDGIPLSGQLDRIEPAPDGRTVNVVDYKTKEPMSANEIMGKTKNSTGNEFRQLVFYKLLLDRWQKGKFKMVSGEIDFLEPNDSGKYKKEKFAISGEQVKELEKVVRDVVSQISELSFWDKSCDDEDCEYCALRKMMA